MDLCSVEGYTAAGVATAIAPVAVGGKAVLFRDLAIIRDSIIGPQVLLDESLFQSLLTRATVMTDQFSDTFAGNVSFASADGHRKTRRRVRYVNGCREECYI